MTIVCRQFTLASRPATFPEESNFKLTETPLPEPKEGEFAVRTLWLSVDPYMRGRIRDVKSYAPPVQIGEVMTGGAVGKVIESKNPRFQVGDVVIANYGWQDHAILDGRGVRKIDADLAPVSTGLGVLGMPGLTAYFGLLEICDPQSGETCFVSGAAGAVGSLVGQIAKIKGCRVVGSAGTDEKVRHLVDDLGFDAAFNYKEVDDYQAKLTELCPEGIDVYFDNVGGALTDAVFFLINVGARIAICGQISQYNLAEPETGPRPFMHLIRTQAKVEGLLVTQFADKYPEGQKQLAEWLKAGKIKYRENVVEGFENTPAAFIGMLKGDNIGKQLVKVSEA